MRVAYVEMIGGASGNMLLGALIDAGADPAAIERALHTIPVGGWTFERARRNKHGIDAAYVDFAIAGEDCAPGEMVAHGHHLADILAIVERSGLSPRVRERASAIYRRLAEAEAKVHGSTVDAIHFHEVGQIDAILDVAGVCVALEFLGVERVMCSPYPLGRGSIAMHHGQYPNPPPATAELMRGAPTVSVDVEGELVTTTAAAILATLVTDPGMRPAMRFEQIGYGAGRSDFRIPNVTRVVIGELALVAGRGDGSELMLVTGRGDGSELALVTGRGDGGELTLVTAGNDAADVPSDDVVVLETNIDDMNPQAFELAIERIFAAGALDVWTSAIGMKKQRPAVLLAAMATPENAVACARAILSETSSIGVRTRRETRYVLAREIVRRLTPYGEVRCKSVRAGDAMRVTLEYDDVVRIARDRALPFATVVAELTRYLESVEHRDERNLV